MTAENKEYIQCPKCMGNKFVNGLGGMTIDCILCSAIGFVDKEIGSKFISPLLMQLVTPPLTHPDLSASRYPKLRNLIIGVTDPLPDTFISQAPAIVGSVQPPAAIETGLGNTFDHSGQAVLHAPPIKASTGLGIPGQAPAIEPVTVDAIAKPERRKPGRKPKLLSLPVAS